MQIVSYFVDTEGRLRCCKAQDRLLGEAHVPVMFEPGGAPVVLTEIPVGAVETTPDGEHPAFLIPARYGVEDGQIRLKAGQDAVPGITWRFPRVTDRLRGWLDEEGIETLPRPVIARLFAAPDRQRALKDAGVTDLVARGVRRMPERLRAWVTLTSPDVAREFRIHEGISLTAMLHAERNRCPVDHPFKCRLGELARRIDEDKTARRHALAKQRQAREKRLADIEAAAAASAWQEMIELTGEADGQAL